MSDVKNVNFIDKFEFCGTSVAVEAKDKLILAHGGVGAVFSTDKMEIMTIDDFKENEVNKIGSVADDIYYIRDLSNKTIFSVFPDHVVKIHVNNYNEIRAVDLVDYLKDEEVSIKEEVFGGHLQTYSFGRQGNTFKISVIIPAGTKVRFNHISGISIPIYLPKLLWTVQATNSGAICSASLKVIKYEDAYGTLTFGHLGLPNIHSTGSICFGSTRNVNQNDSGDKSVYPVVMAERAWSLFINSTFNNDLLAHDRASGYPVMPTLPGLENVSLYPELVKVLNVLGTPDGYTKVTYASI